MLDAVVDEYIKKGDLGGAVVAVASGKKTVYVHAAGRADLESDIPMRENTIFRLASVTKLFTCVAALRLVEQGLLPLDEPVTKWLPWFRPPLPDGSPSLITPRQLFSHTAGLSYGFAEASDGPYHRAGVSDGLDGPLDSMQENLARLATVPLRYQPGHGWEYSLATDVLGEIVAQCRAQSLPAALRDLVTDPLGLTDSGFSPSDSGRLAVPYHRTNGFLERIQDNQAITLGPDSESVFVPSQVFNPQTTPAGGAGMLSTATDILRVLMSVCTGGAPLLEQKTVQLAMTNQIGTCRVEPGWGFGLGWAVLVDPKKGRTSLSKGSCKWGGVYGHSWFIDFERQLSLVALTNTTPDGVSGTFPTAVSEAACSMFPHC